jgi:phage tail sheath gpL-like
VSNQLYPEVRDATTLGARFSQPIFLTIGVEGQADSGGTAAVAVPKPITRPADADTQFGAGSSLAGLVKFLLARGAPSVIAVASAKGTVPTLAQRQAAWAILESDVFVRIRLTDSAVQADHVELADSCEDVELIQNKQTCFVGMPAGTSLANLTTAAATIASKRAVLVGPGIYDASGNLLSGVYAAAAVAVEVAKNPDLADDLDKTVIPGMTGIEKDANGMPIFRLKVASGVAVNDFETLLQGGVSPLEQDVTPAGGVLITHLRTTYTVDTTMDALMTRLIVDQLFIDVRQYALDGKYLRRGNTQQNRDDLKAGVEALLTERSNWIRPKTQPDGTLGYLVAVTSSTDGRKVTISYQGIVIRGIQTIEVDAQLDIPV